MQADRFRDLLDSRGPFVSVYFDDAQSIDLVDLKWRALREQLERLGVRDSLTDEVQQAVVQWRPSSCRGRAVVACVDGVLFNEHLLRPTATTVMRVSELPYIVPIVEYGSANPSYLLAMVDHTGADIAVQIDGSHYSEAAAGDTGFVVGRLVALLDATAADAVFVAGDARARAELVDALPVRVCEQVVSLPISARRGEYDFGELGWAIEAWFLNRQISAIGDAAERFGAELGRQSGLAVQGLCAVCSALRRRVVDTLIVGDIGDATVVTDQSLSAVAPNADLLVKQGVTPAKRLRADEALPLFAIASDASLVRTDERIAPADGIAAVLRHASLACRRGG